MLINKQMAEEKQRLFELDDGEVWNDFHEQINELLHQEKAARQEVDAFKTSEICLRIVSSSNKIWLAPALL
jgi:hypothetical protein